MASDNVGKLNEVLTLRRLPARLNYSQTATVLGFSEHDVPVLVRAKLLKPLGKPALNAPKFLAAEEIEQFSRDRQWLDKATKAVSEHWKHKNQNTTK